MQRMKVPAMPVFIHGGNSPAFHAAGMLNPRLRTMMLPSELLNKTGSRIRVSVGSPDFSGSPRHPNTDGSARRHGLPAGADLYARHPR